MHTYPEKTKLNFFSKDKSTMCIPILTCTENHNANIFGCHRE